MLGSENELSLEEIKSTTDKAIGSLVNDNFLSRFRGYIN